MKFVTNESARTRAGLHAKLLRLGFDMPIEDILTPAMAMMQVKGVTGSNTPQNICHKAKQAKLSFNPIVLY